MFILKLVKELVKKSGSAWEVALSKNGGDRNYQRIVILLALIIGALIGYWLGGYGGIIIGLIFGGLLLPPIIDFAMFATTGLFVLLLPCLVVFLDLRFYLILLLIAGVIWFTVKFWGVR